MSVYKQIKEIEELLQTAIQKLEEIKELYS